MKEIHAVIINALFVFIETNIYLGMGFIWALMLFFILHIAFFIFYIITSTKNTNDK